MSTGNTQVTYCWRPAGSNGAVAIFTTAGNYINTLHCKDYTAVIIQGEEVIFTLKTGKTVVYTVRGNYKGCF
jgi:hypothetical protein